MVIPNIWSPGCDFIAGARPGARSHGLGVLQEILQPIFSSSEARHKSVSSPYFFRIDNHFNFDRAPFYLRSVANTVVRILDALCITTAGGSVSEFSVLHPRTVT